MTQSYFFNFRIFFSQHSRVFRQLGNNIIMTQSYFFNFRIFFSQHSRVFRQLGNNIIMTQSYFFNFRIFFPNIHVFYVQLRQFDIHNDCLMADAVPDSAKKVHHRLNAVGTVGAQSADVPEGLCTPASYVSAAAALAHPGLSSWTRWQHPCEVL